MPRLVGAQGRRPALQYRNFFFSWQAFLKVRLFTFTLCPLPFDFLLRLGRPAPRRRRLPYNRFITLAK
jgi:hypothetical protein